MDADGKDAKITVNEAFVPLTNPWGTVIMGEDDGADDVMMVGGYSLLTAGFGYDGGYTSAVNLGGVGFKQAYASLVGDTGDATKVSYYTPRTSGLQLGASWTPDSGSTLDESLADHDGDVDNHFGVGVNYINKIGDVGIKLGATYNTAEQESAYVIQTKKTVDNEDILSWSIGGTLSFSGFSVGMGYGDNGDSNCPKNNMLCDAGDWWDIAGQYKFGTTTIAGGYLNNESNVKGSAVQADEVDVWTLGVSHKISHRPPVCGPGLRCCSMRSIVRARPASTMRHTS